MKPLCFRTFSSSLVGMRFCGWIGSNVLFQPLPQDSIYTEGVCFVISLGASDVFNFSTEILSPLLEICEWGMYVVLNAIIWAAIDKSCWILCMLQLGASLLLGTIISHCTRHRVSLFLLEHQQFILLSWYASLSAYNPLFSTFCTYSLQFYIRIQWEINEQLKAKTVSAFFT